MENQEILSFCIPTYNRDYLIERELSYLCPVANEFDIPIYISDNASPDNTAQVLEKYRALYPKIIHYESQKHNIGPDANFEYVLKMSCTKYRWLMADCSFIDVAGLQMVLTELRDSDYDLYVTGGETDRVASFCSEIFTDPSKLLETIGWHMTWISCLIFSKRLVDCSYFERYYNSNFIHTGVIFEYLAYHKCNVRFNKDVIVDTLGVEKRGHWTNHIFDIFARNWFLFVFSLPLVYSYESKIKCVKDSSRHASALQVPLLAKHKINKMWSFSDLIKNKFFVKQAFNYRKLFLIGLSPNAIVHCYLFCNRIKMGIIRRVKAKKLFLHRT